MVRIDRVTTRGGDSGETSLGDGTRLAKDTARIEAIGAVDEANAALGVLRTLVTGDHEAMIARLQNDLFDLGADLCVPETDHDRPRLRLTDAPTLRLEAEAEALRAAQPPLTSFILPGGSPAAAHAHLARTVLRRAERRVVSLARQEKLNPSLVRYLNRASDTLFVLARALNDGHDIPWVPGAGR
jgi:cob(I)alamin adenosyltransferase